MSNTHESGLVIGPREAGGLRVTFEGRTAWLGVTGTPAQMRESAERLEAEAADRSWRARRARALADLWEAEANDEAIRRAAQRNARAAATRAHNRDPWGFDALVATMAEPEEEGR